MILTEEQRLIFLKWERTGLLTDLNPINSINCAIALDSGAKLLKGRTLTLENEISFGLFLSAIRRKVEWDPRFDIDIFAKNFFIYTEEHANELTELREIYARLRTIIVNNWQLVRADWETAWLIENINNIESN